MLSQGRCLSATNAAAGASPAAAARSTTRFGSATLRRGCGLRAWCQRFACQAYATERALPAQGVNKTIVGHKVETWWQALGFTVRRHKRPDIMRQMDSSPPKAPDD